MPHDVIIIGSGAGCAAAAYVLAHAGLDVLLIERGPVLPRDGSTLDVPIVAGEGRFLSKERWHDRHGRTIVPQERFNLGGKTKWYGAALVRFSPHEFAADGRVHGIENLYVVDGSALPRSSRANPALTIFAWSMRVADRMSGGRLLANTTQDRSTSSGPRRRTDNEYARSASAHPLRT